MKKYISVALLLLVLLALTGCSGKPYEFKKSVDEIKTIEIVWAEDSLDYTVRKTLSESEKEEFLEQFLELEFDRYLFGDPSSVHGDAVKITYKNGDYEIICHHWAEYVKNGKAGFLWKNCEDDEDFNNLLKKFSD